MTKKEILSLMLVFITVITSLASVVLSYMRLTGMLKDNKELLFIASIAALSVALNMALNWRDM